MSCVMSAEFGEEGSDGLDAHASSLCHIHVEQIQCLRRARSTTQQLMVSTARARLNARAM